VVAKEEVISCFHKIDHEVNPYNKYITKFRQVRVVTMNGDRQLQCSCCHFSRFGFGCVHLLSVVLLRENQHKNNDIWSKYYMELLDNDIKGPSMPEDWKCSDFSAKSNVPAEFTEDSIFALKPAFDRLRNYSSGQAKVALRIFADGSNGTFAGHVGYSQLCNMDKESDLDFEIPSIDIDVPTANTQQQTDARSRLKPIFDQICSLYESKHATHCDMPTLDSVVDAMNNKIHDVNRFFCELDIKKTDRQNDKENYISVCTQKESSRNRCFVSSNGLR
jgi:SWIM zinc finger